MFGINSCFSRDILCNESNESRHSACSIRLSLRYVTDSWLLNCFLRANIELVENEVVSQISRGLMVLVGIGTGQFAV